MPSTPTTGTSGNSYATIAEADTYLDDSPRAAVAWEDIDDDDKARALIGATRLMDKQRWKGSKTDAANTLAWPRTGITDKEGEAVDENTVPADIINATIELAYELSQDAELEASRSTASNDKKYVAGSVSIEFFRPGGAEGVDGQTRFPYVVMECIRHYLRGYGTYGQPSAYGTCDESVFDESGDRSTPLS